MSSKAYGVYLTYDATRHRDGLGAQTQRLMGVYAAAKKLNLGYHHTHILTIEPNPGETTEIVQDLVLFARQSFDMSEEDSIDFDWRISIKSLDKKSQAVLYFLNTFAMWLRLRISCLITYPYAVTDVYPDLYELPAKQIRKRFQNSNSDGVFRIDLHIRRSVVPRVDSSGAPYFRFLETKWYVQVLSSITSFMDQKRKPYLIRIHTDEISELWNVPPDLSVETRELWRDLGVIGEDGCLVPSVEPIEKVFSHFSNVEMARGWHPIQAMNSMISANLLVTYPSSFSYVAGLIRSRNPVISPKFWHKSPSWWLTLPQLIDEDPGPAIYSYLGFRFDEADSR